MWIVIKIDNNTPNVLTTFKDEKEWVYNYLSKGKHKEIIPHVIKAVEKKGERNKFYPELVNQFGWIHIGYFSTIVHKD